MIFFYIICLLVSVLMFFVSKGTYDTTYIYYNYILTFLMLSIYFLFNSKNLKSNFLKHSTIFLISYIIVHYQKLLDYILGYSYFDYKVLIDEKVVTQSISASTAGLAAFFCGYFIVKKIKTNNLLKFDPFVKLENTLPLLPLKGAALILLILFLITVNPLYLMGFYGEEGMGEGAKYFILLNFIIQSLFVLNLWKLKYHCTINSIKEYILSYGKFFNSLLAVYLLIILLSGDRGPILVNALLYFGGYYFCSNKKINILLFIGIFLISSFIISTLGNSRNYSKDISYIDRINMSLIDAKRDKVNTISPITYEMSGSFKCINLSIEYINKSNDFQNGKFQRNYLLSTIPGYNSLWKQNDKEYQSTGSMKNFSSADFLTYIVQGPYPYSGIGTTCIADLFLDFGIIGILVGMFLFGILLKKCELNLFDTSRITLFSFIISIVFFSYSFYIPRGCILTYIRSSIVIYLIIYLYITLYTIIVKNYKKRVI